MSTFKEKTKKVVKDLSSVQFNVNDNKKGQDDDFVVFDGDRYYQALKLQKSFPSFFEECTTSIRQIINVKNIQDDQYLYASHSVKTGWTKAKDKSQPTQKSRLLISEKWANDNIPGILNVDDKPKKVKYKKVPELLILNDEEKFKNNDGQIFEIETRGKRTPDEIYFLASDVARSLKMNKNNFIISLINKNRGYERCVHYDTFVCDNIVENKLTTSRRTYLTYCGMMKVLFSSRSGVADSFVKWASDTLFVIQMGTFEQKEHLVTGLFGLTKDQLKLLLKVSATPISCIYRFALGQVKELRKSMNISKNIPDEYIIIKCGRTDNLKRRINEHKKMYERIENCKLELMGFGYIAEEHLVTAENELKNYFKESEVQILYEIHTELFACDPKNEKDICDTYGEISRKYSGEGGKKQYVSEIETLNLTISKITHEMELQKEKHKTHVSELEKTIMKLSFEKDIMVQNEKHLQLKLKQYIETENIMISHKIKK